MSWLHFAAATFAATTTTAAVNQPTPSDHENSEIIELQRERFERMTVPVTIMGEGPFRFVVDTGAQSTVVSSSLADRLMLKDRRIATLVAMASREQVEIADIDQFSIGSRTLNIINVPILLKSNIGDADGILGIDALQDKRVMLDFVNDRILVADARQYGTAGYEIVVRAKRKLGQLIITDASLDGVRATVIIDTGAQGSVGNPALLQKLRRSKDLGINEMTDVNGNQLSGSVRQVNKLELGIVQLNHIPILFADAPPFHALGLSDKPALILGMEQLRMFRRVAIDFDRRQVLFDLPSSVGAKSYERRQGYH